ncbi:MAG: 6-bladed beta-propeller [Bacteroidota bacterium]|nr:6-bladed beta-propeller [Bacteroidota bacterium]
MKRSLINRDVVGSIVCRVLAINYRRILEAILLSVGMWCLVAVITGFVITGCSHRHEVDHSNEIPLERARNSPLNSIRLELDSVIGSDVEEDYLFSIVRGLAIDNEDNLVVFDGILKNVRVFNTGGQLLRKHSLKDGDGPGEFRRASTFSLSHDKQRVYLYDMVSRRITIMDYATFDYVAQIPIPETQHAVVKGASDRRILVLYNQLDLGDGSLVHVFSESGTKLATFERRHPEYSTYLRQNLQAFHHVSMAQSDSLIFLSFALPYDLRMYNRQYQLLRRFHLTPDFFGGTVRDGEWVYPSGYTSNLVVADDNLLLQFVTDRENEETWLHSFDFAGRSRGVQRLVNNSWGDRFGLYSGAVDSKGRLYGVTYDPFPKIIRLRVVSGTPDLEGA